MAKTSAKLSIEQTSSGGGGGEGGGRRSGHLIVQQPLTRRADYFQECTQLLPSKYFC